MKHLLLGCLAVGTCLACIISSPTVELPEQPSTTPISVSVTPTASEPTAELIPQASLSDTGPWVLVRGEAGLWAANPDGSGLSFIYDVWPDELAIGGRHAAFIEETDGYYGSGLVLKVFSLPDGEVTTVTELLSAETEPQPEDMTIVSGKVAIFTALQTDNLAWSSDGTRLAFVSAHESPSADLYIYSTEDGSLTRLSDEPSQAFRPIWSPDGERIVLMGAETFGTGAGYSMSGVWSVCADGSCFESLFEPQSGDELSLGWTSDNTIVLYSFNTVSGFNNLRSYNLDTGETTTLWDAPFEEATLDPASGTLLVVVDDSIAEYVADVEAGLYLVGPNGQVDLAEVWDFFSEELRADVSWHPEASVFLIKLSNEFISLTPEGQAELIVPRILNYPQPKASPQGDIWCWLDDGMLVLNGPEIEIQILFPSDSHPLWGPDGDTLLFVYKGQLHQGRIDDLSTTATGSDLSGGLRWMTP